MQNQDSKELTPTKAQELQCNPTQESSLQSTPEESPRTRRQRSTTEAGYNRNRRREPEDKPEDQVSRKIAQQWEAWRDLYWNASFYLSDAAPGCRQKTAGGALGTSLKRGCYRGWHQTRSLTIWIQRYLIGRGPGHIMLGCIKGQAKSGG